MSSSSCAFCNHPDREALEVNVAKGDILKTALARELGTSVDKVIEHMDEHFSRKESYTPLRPESIQALYNKRDVLNTNMVNLVNRLDAKMNKDELSQKDTKAIVDMMSELRRTVMDLAKLEGELKEEQKITYVHYTQLRTLVIQSLCEKCRKKALSELNVEDVLVP